MGFCFICDSPISGTSTRVCSTRTPHCNVPYAEKIAELSGDECVVIVTPADYLCNRCTSLIIHMDKLEHDVKLVKDTIVSHIQKKYDLLPPDYPVRTLDIVNGHIKNFELEVVSQRKVSSGLNRDTTILPSKESKPNKNSKIKVYKCGFCSYQSNELGNVRHHMGSHVNKKNEGHQANPTMTKPLTQDKPQQKKCLYRCQVCSKSFDSRVICLEHINKVHNQQHSTEKKAVSQVSQSKMTKTENYQQAQSYMNSGQLQQGYNSGPNTYTLSNNKRPSEGTTNGLHEMYAQEEAARLNQMTTNDILAVDLDVIMDGADNNTDDLDLESMLAAIHNDTS